MFYACGGSKTRVKRISLIMILTGDIQKHWQATKKNKPLDAPNSDRHQKKTKKQKFQQLLASAPIVPGNFRFLIFFGAFAGFGDSRLCMFGSGPYFKLLFQRSKHTIIFEQLCHHTGCLILLVNSMTHFSVSLLSLSLSNYWNETADKTLQDNNDKQDMYLLLEL